MNYYENPVDPDQKQPLEPKSIISGQLPGATEIRLGNNIKISGKNQQILVTTTGGMVTIGSTSDGRLAMEATNTDGSKVGIGDIPGTTNLGLYSVDSSSHTTMVLGKQADGTNSLKFFDVNNIGLAQFGNFLSGGIALKVAKAGIEVGSATNDQLIFNSGQNIFKIITPGIGTVVVPTPFTSGTVITTPIAHGVTGKPAFRAFVDIPAGDGSALLQGKLTTIPASLIKSGGAASVSATVDVDATNIYLRVANVAGTGLTGVDGTWTFKYYIEQETAT